LWCDSFFRLLLLSVSLALVCSFAGILLSYHAGLASGAAIVLCLGVVFVGSAVLSPRYGAAALFLDRWRNRHPSVPDSR
jgi:ABC-type Mn2+/Zn2+ transport system permease subunit